MEMKVIARNQKYIVLYDDISGRFVKVRKLRNKHMMKILLRSFSG